MVNMKLSMCCKLSDKLENIKFQNTANLATLFIKLFSKWAQFFQKIWDASKIILVGKERNQSSGREFYSI